SYEAIGDYENAVKDFDKGIKLLPDRADFYVYKARVLRKMGRAEEALKICNNSMKMLTRLRILLLTRAQILMSQNKLELARRDFESLINLNPTEYVSLYNLCLLEIQLGRLKSARYSLTRLKKLTGDRQYLLFAEAFLFIEEKKNEEGVALLRTFLREFPKHPNANLARENIATYERYLKKKKAEAETLKKKTEEK
ncbi:MAG: tetratricopeptide repeat protein, partial [Planctomycetota bacterium]|nr:tetratricopeptide repeat protein [Planctomycetota bacterium]